MLNRQKTCGHKVYVPHPAGGIGLFQLSKTQDPHSKGMHSSSQTFRPKQSQQQIWKLIAEFPFRLQLRDGSPPGNSTNRKLTVKDTKYAEQDPPFKTGCYEEKSKYEYVGAFAQTSTR